MRQRIVCCLPACRHASSYLGDAALYAYSSSNIVCLVLGPEMRHAAPCPQNDGTAIMAGRDPATAGRWVVTIAAWTSTYSMKSASVSLTSVSSCQGRSARAVLATWGSSGSAAFGCRSAETSAARPAVLLTIAAAPSAICVHAHDFDRMLEGMYF